MLPRSLTVHLTDADYLAFTLFTNNRNHGNKKGLFVLGIIMIALGALQISFKLLAHGVQFPGTWGIFCLVYGLMLVLFRNQLHRAGLKSQVKALKKKGSLPYSPESTYEFKEDCLRCIIRNEIADTGYTAIAQICVIPDKVVYLYKTTISAYIIPMSAFSSVEEWHALLRFLQSKNPNLPVHFCAE